MIAANDKDLSVCSLNIVISVLLGRVVGNAEAIVEKENSIL
jgi:hypothetical protein